MAALSDAGDTSTATGRTRLMGEGLCSCRERSSGIWEQVDICQKDNEGTYGSTVVDGPLGLPFLLFSISYF